MGVFKSEQVLPYSAKELGPVAEELKAHFEAKGYEVVAQPMLGGGWDVSIHQGSVFKAVVGMKTALKIEILPRGTTTVVKAGIGIFGQQAVPTAITMLIFWPVAAAQIWGLVRQSKLDDEALTVVEESLRACAGGVPPEQAHTAGGAPGTGSFCTNCGAELTAGGAFCPGCAAPVAASDTSQSAPATK